MGIATAQDNRLEFPPFGGPLGCAVAAFDQHLPPVDNCDVRNEVAGYTARKIKWPLLGIIGSAIQEPAPLHLAIIIAAAIYQASIYKVISMAIVPIIDEQHEHNREDDTEDSTSIESGGKRSRLIVVVPAILSRDPVKNPWTQFSDRTNRNLNHLYGNSARVQLQTNLQFVVHSLKPNTLSKRLIIVLVTLCILIGAATAPFVFWSVSVYCFGVSVLVGGFLLISRECSKSPVQKLSLAKEKIRQLCSKLNEKHSHKVLVVFDGTDLCFFSTTATNATKAPANGLENQSKDPPNTLDDAAPLQDADSLPLHSSSEKEEAGNEGPTETTSEEIPPFVASWSSSKFSTFDPTPQSTRAIFRWKPQETPNKLQSSPSSAPVQDIEAQDLPSKQLLIARGIGEDSLEFVSAGMLTPWVLPMAPSHVDEPTTNDTRNDIEILEATDAIDIRTLQSSSSQSNDRHSILHKWRKPTIGGRETK